MGKIIVIGSQKGGVGKTTTTANLGIGLARQDKRVLLIDADAQGSLTLSLGYPKPDELPITLADIMQNVIDDAPIPDGCGILHHSEVHQSYIRNPVFHCLPEYHRHFGSYHSSLLKPVLLLSQS